MSRTNSFVASTNAEIQADRLIASLNSYRHGFARLMDSYKIRQSPKGTHRLAVKLDNDVSWLQTGFRRG